MLVVSLSVFCTEKRNGQNLLFLYTSAHLCFDPLVMYVCCVMCRYEISALKSPFYSTSLNFYTLGNKITKAEYEKPPPHFSKTVSTHRIQIEYERPMRCDVAPYHAHYSFNLCGLLLVNLVACTDRMDDSAHSRESSRHRSSVARCSAGM